LAIAERETAMHPILLRFIDLAPKTRSIIVQSLTSLLDPFMRSPLRELFCTDTTFTPEDAQRGKIILLDPARTVCRRAVGGGQLRRQDPAPHGR
jgi:hypothetical protein